MTTQNLEPVHKNNINFFLNCSFSKPNAGLNSLEDKVEKFVFDACTDDQLLVIAKVMADNFHKLSVVNSEIYSKEWRIVEENGSEYDRLVLAFDVDLSQFMLYHAYAVNPKNVPCIYDDYNHSYFAHALAYDIYQDKVIYSGNGFQFKARAFKLNEAVVEFNKESEDVKILAIYRK